MAVEHLGAAVAYEAADRSRAFPTVPLRELARFLRPAEGMDNLTALREFRAWVRTLPKA